MKLSNIVKLSKSRLVLTEGSRDGAMATVWQPGAPGSELWARAGAALSNKIDAAIATMRTSLIRPKVPKSALNSQ